MSKLDKCVSEILRIEREDGPDAVSLAEKKADEFLAPFSRNGRPLLLLSGGLG